MRNNKHSFGEKISNWKVIHTNLAPKLPEMPHLTEMQQQLQGVIERAEALDSEAEINRQRRAELARDRRTLVREGDQIRSRAAAHLKGTFGFGSDQLIEFGLNPLKSGRRRKKVETPPPAGESAKPTA